MKNEGKKLLLRHFWEEWRGEKGTKGRRKADGSEVDKIG